MSKDAIEGNTKKSKKDNDKKRKHIELETEDEAVRLKREKKERKREKKRQKLEQEAASTPDSTSAFLTTHNISITSDDPITPFTAFDQLHAHPAVTQELSTAFKAKYPNFKEPTPIQACAWPPALDGKDVIGIAETGSGKTLGFGVPALARLLRQEKSKGVNMLVVAPTRELAIQTHETLDELGQSLGITSVAVYGGVGKDQQIKLLKKKKTKIVVGTPGRIIDLVNEGSCDLSAVNYLVLDEADRMLDKGFENDITKIIGYAKPKGERQTMMFSATWPPSVRRLADSFLNNPVRISVGAAATDDTPTTNKRIEQVVEVLDDKWGKDKLLQQYLRTHLSDQSIPSPIRVLVFALYKQEVPRIIQFLERQAQSNGFGKGVTVEVNALHGDINQNARMQALEWFKTSSTTVKSGPRSVRVLVATDVAARGLDIPSVGLVINYTFPLTVEDYVHRIGRTGRGGSFGKSVTFFSGEGQEKSLAGEFVRLLSEGGEEPKGLETLRAKFPMTIKKKVHAAYGAFYKNIDKDGVNGRSKEEEAEVIKRRKIVF